MSEPLVLRVQRMGNSLESVNYRVRVWEEVGKVLQYRVSLEGVDETLGTWECLAAYASGRCVDKSE